MSGVTAHVLDTTLGKPAAGVEIVLAQLAGAAAGQGMDPFAAVGHAVTNDDGRISDLSRGAGLRAGTYRITFNSGAYFARRGVPSFYPQVEVIFQVTDPAQHYHIPLLLSPFGYSTYRGS